MGQAGTPAPGRQVAPAVAGGSKLAESVLGRCTEATPDGESNCEGLASELEVPGSAGVGINLLDEVRLVRGRDIEALMVLPVIAILWLGDRYVHALARHVAAASSAARSRTWLRLRWLPWRRRRQRQRLR